MAAQSRMIFNPEEKSINGRKRKATDMPQNARVDLPKAIDKSEEAERLVRGERYMQTLRNFKYQQWNSDWRQTSNLDHNERQDLSKITNRVKEGEIIIWKTGKTDKLVAVDPDQYIVMGMEHVGQNRQIDWKEAGQVQKTLNSHTSYWLKILNVGAD